MTAAVMSPAGLLTAETFVSFQGEGPSAGQPAAFIRLSRCNLSCAFCDTPYTWDWSRYRPGDAIRQTAGELASWAAAQPVGLVVITGGEPLLQQGALVPLAAALAEAGRGIEIETNGTLVPLPGLAELVTRFNVSPKLSGSGVPARRRVVPDALTALAALSAIGKAVFKFVICRSGELEEVAELQARYGLAPGWVMPEGTSEQAVLAGMRAIAETALARGWGLSSRLHVLLWGDERGR